MKGLKIVRSPVDECDHNECDHVCEIPDSYDARLARMFSDLKVYRSEWCGDVTVSCTFTISKIAWDVLRKHGELGTLYNCDLSNYLSRNGKLNFYAVPSVDDSSRSNKGRKTIKVSFTKRGAR